MHCLVWRKSPDTCPTCAVPELAYLDGLKKAKAERSAKRAAGAKQRIAAQLEQERQQAQGASASP